MGLSFDSKRVAPNVANNKRDHAPELFCSGTVLAVAFQHRSPPSLVIGLPVVHRSVVRVSSFLGFARQNESASAPPRRRANTNAVGETGIWHLAFGSSQAVFVHHTPLIVVAVHHRCCCSDRCNTAPTAVVGSCLSWGMRARAFCFAGVVPRSNNLGNMGLRRRSGTSNDASNVVAIDRH